MRPLRRSAVPDHLHHGWAVDHVMNALGAYCALCERPLLAENFFWNKETGAVGQRTATASEWPHLLPVCHNCAEVQAHTKAQVIGPLLLPDQQATFTLDATSPFSYKLEATRRVPIDDQGIPSGEPQTTTSVIIHGATVEARNSIERFKLNTPFFDAASRTFRIPHHLYFSAYDRRVDLRTEAWKKATILAETLPKLRHWDTSPHYLIFMHRMIEGEGFWSVWATVLAPIFADKNVLRSVLMPETAGPRLDPLRPPVSFLRGTAVDVL